jgi:hypothetical protein
MLITAFSQSPTFCAPALSGLNCRVNLPIPARRITFAMRTLQDRQHQTWFQIEMYDSSPVTW